MVLVELLMLVIVTPRDEVATFKYPLPNANEGGTALNCAPAPRLNPATSDTYTPSTDSFPHIPGMALPKLEVVFERRLSTCECKSPGHFGVAATL
jgi:hypothetical protein